MQSGAGTISQSGVNSWNNTLPTMYPNNQQQQQQQPQQQQRNTSNPRPFPSSDSPIVGGERRDDQAYSTDTQGSHQYANYQQQGSYSAVPNYNQYGSQMNTYNAASPTVAAASSSRRTSNPKAGTTPPAINTQSASARYYSQSTAESQYPQSAPPTVTSHSQQHSVPQSGQPMTAHAYGAGYYYPPESYPGYYQNQTPSTSRSSGQPQSSTPTTATATMDTSRSGGGSYDYNQPMSSGYPSAQYPYQWPQQSRSSMPGQAGQWQGYPMNTQPMPHGYPSQMQQYPMHSWQGGYYPPGTQPHPSTMAPMASKKGKDKGKDDFKGNKRLSEAAELSPTDKKGKKLKKDEEKPIPKPPPKSHLKAPPQAQSMWQLFFTDELNKAKAAARATSPGGTVQNAKLNVAKIAQEAGIAYNKLNDEQKEYYGAKVAESKAEHEEALKNWHKTLTPEDIRKENVYRAQMRKEGKSRKGNLKDPNAPKKPLSAYFLFLKGIRENDDLRAEVWGKETETTKQSVLAAERWRGLSDDERRPFLNQAENDKQTYETARKIYEEEAAARARGELVDSKTDPTAEASTTVPPIPISAHTPAVAQTLVDVNDHVVVPPTPQVLDPTQTPQQAVINTSPDFAQFTNDSDEDKKPLTSAFDTSLDDFQGFPDPLHDMDLTGLGGITSEGEQANQQWDDLHNLMGEQTSSGAKSEVEDIDVAPTMEEAVAETTEISSFKPLASTEPEIQQVAGEAEGHIGIPDAGPVEQNASGIPTQEVSDMPLVQDAPPALEQTSLGGQDQSFDNSLDDSLDSVLDVPASPPAEE